MAIIEDLLPLLDCSEEEYQIIKRIVHATGDPRLLSSFDFSRNTLTS